MKYIDLKEFVETGYLQELNRQFLHPLGLALEVRVDEQGSVTLGGVQDCRDDPEGFAFDFRDLGTDKAAHKARRVLQLGEARIRARMKALGCIVQPVE